MPSDQGSLGLSSYYHPATATQVSLWCLPSSITRVNLRFSFALAPCTHCATDAWLWHHSRLYPGEGATGAHTSAAATVTAATNVACQCSTTISHTKRNAVPCMLAPAQLLWCPQQLSSVTSSPACLSPVPQILNVVRAHSAEGLSATAFELESWGLMVHASYGYINRLPFSSYGEAAILLAQNLLLLSMVYRYARLPAGRVTAVLSLIVGAIAVVASGGRFFCGWGSSLGSRSGVSRSGCRKGRVFCGWSPLVGIVGGQAVPLVNGGVSSWWWMSVCGCGSKRLHCGPCPFCQSLRHAHGLHAPSFASLLPPPSP